MAALAEIYAVKRLGVQFSMKIQVFLRNSVNRMNFRCLAKFLQCIRLLCVSVWSPENDVELSTSSFLVSKNVKNSGSKNDIFENSQNDEISLWMASPGLQGFEIIRFSSYMARRAGMLSFLALE